MVEPGSGMAYLEGESEDDREEPSFDAARPRLRLSVWKRSISDLGGGPVAIPQPPSASRVVCCPPISDVQSRPSPSPSVPASVCFGRRMVGPLRTQPFGCLARLRVSRTLRAYMGHLESPVRVVQAGMVHK